MIHLARFEFQGSAAGLQGGAAKLTQKIEYPEKLDMGQYMIDGLLDRTYVLRGILVHEGETTASGHHYTYAFRDGE
ncbi:TPA: Ubiquitin carboxyl-terminal hydrolase 42 [Trebouxia sp. C0006]